MPHQKILEEKMISISRILAGTVVAICMTVLVGWVFDIAVLRLSFPHASGMNPTSTFTFIAASLSCIALSQQGPRYAFIGVLAAALVFFVGVLKVTAMFLPDFPFQVDQLFFLEKIAQVEDPYVFRMSLTSAIGFTLFGAALLLKSKAKGSKLFSYSVQALCSILAAGSFFLLIAYVYKIPMLFDNLKVLNISLRSAICFFIISIALMITAVGYGFIKHVTSPYGGGKLLRRVIPVALLLPLATGVISLVIKDELGLSMRTGTSLLIFILVIGLLAILTLNAIVLNQKDAEGLRRENQIKLANTALGTSYNEVSALNEELAASNEELASSNEELSASNDKLHALNAHLEEANLIIQKQANLIASQNEEKLNRILDSSREVIWSYNFLEIKESYISRSAERTYNISRQDFLTNPDFWQTKIHPAYKTRVLNKIETIDHSDFVEMAFRVRSDQRESWQYCRFRRVTDSNGSRVLEEGIISDITGLKKTELELNRALQSLGDFKKAIDRSSIVSRADLKGNILEVNENFEKISGFKKGELVGKNHRIVNSGYHPKSFWIEMWKTVSSGGVWRAEVKNKAKDGSYYWVDTFIMPFLNETGHIIEYLSIRNDITNKKEYETKLTTIARELSNLIESANVPIFAIDTQGYINEWNAVAEQVTGVSRMDLIGKRWIDQFVMPQDYPEVHALIDGVLQEGRSVSNFEVSIRGKDATIQKFLMSASPRLDAEMITGVIMVAQNITELFNYRSNLERMVHERTRELNEALASEKNVVDLRSKFISIASHEFRTPLSTITLLAGTIKKYRARVSENELDEKLDSILKQVNHMTYLLDDVLTIGKSDAGKIQIVYAVINPVAFLATISREVEQATAITHEIRLSKSMTQDKFVTDEKLLRNILINVLTNAIKFSPEANHVDVNIETDSDMMIIDVTDYGMGIPQADLKNLFEPFSRGSNVTAIQGTGLGLSIIKKALDLLSGRIDIQSEVGKGTRITVTIPNLYDPKDSTC